LLGKIGPCVFDWGDYELELSENTIEKLGARENRGPLSPSRSPSKSSGGDNLKLKNLPGVSQSARIVQMLQRISRDLDLSIDIKRKLSEEPNLISDYARLLVLEGAKDHAAAAEHLGIEPGEAEEVAIRLEGLLEGLLN